MFYFDTEEIAESFIEVMSEKYFNKFKLEGEILKPRF